MLLNSVERRLLMNAGSKDVDEEIAKRIWFYKNKIYCRPVLLYSEVKDIISALEETERTHSSAYQKMLKQSINMFNKAGKSSK